VDAARIPGYWYNRKGTTIELGHRADDGEQVFYIIHGGGFVFFSASPADWAATAPRKLLEYCPNVRRAFAIEYRLATAEPYVPVNPFPAALIDVLAGYNYLVNVVGFSPKNIIIEGDSAGGNLALALTRYLLEYQNDPVVNLPAPPGSLILLSPWADLSSSHYFPGSSALTFKSTDYLLSPSEGLSGYSKSALFGPLGPTVGKTNVYISPACLYSSIGTVSFKNFPRTYISAGGGERLLDQITTLKRLMEEDMGAGTGEGQVFYHEAPHAPHDFILYPHEPQRTNTLRSIAKWMDRTLECDSEDNRLRQSARS
jgi:acetyl esterase/lipase